MLHTIAIDAQKSRVEVFFEQFNEWIRQQSGKKWFSSRERLCSSSHRPGSLLTVAEQSVSGAAATQQHPGYTASPCRVKCTNNPLSFRKSERASLHREKEKRPVNVIFYLLFSVGWCWNFCSWHAFVNQSCQDTSCFGVFTTVTSCPSCLDCWRSSMILMSILWEAAFPWVSFYTLQGYLYT